MRLDFIFFQQNCQVFISEGSLASLGTVIQTRAPQSIPLPVLHPHNSSLAQSQGDGSFMTTEGKKETERNHQDPLGTVKHIAELAQMKILPHLR